MDITVDNLRSVVRKYKFENWLKKNKNKYFYTCNSDSCPLAEYVLAKFPKADTVSVEEDQVVISFIDKYSEYAKFSEVSIHLPDWATTFVINVDASTDNDEKRITSKYALDTLRKVA